MLVDAPSAWLMRQRQSMYVLWLAIIHTLNGVLTTKLGLNYKLF